VVGESGTKMIDLTRHGPIATLTLARPAKHNAIDLATTRALRDAAKDLELDPDVRVIVIAAQGPSFSVGGDLEDFIAHRARIAQHLDAMTDALHAAVVSLRRAAAPVIASVNGAAAGGGLGLMLAADLVIAGRSARFVSAYTKVGLTPDSGVSFFLPRKVGAGRAFDLMATNRALTADEALQIGLVERVVPDDELASQTHALATALADSPSSAVGKLKLLLAHELPLLEAHLAREAASIATIAAQPATQARLEAFKAELDARRHPR